MNTFDDTMSYNFLHVYTMNNYCYKMVHWEKQVEHVHTCTIKHVYILIVPETESTEPIEPLILFLFTKISEGVSLSYCTEVYLSIN